MREDQIDLDINIKTSKLIFNKSRNGNSSNRRVDINELLSRARQDEKKQKKENLFFFGAIASIIAITGIIASL